MLMILQDTLLKLTDFVVYNKYRTKKLLQRLVPYLYYSKGEIGL